MQAAWKHSEISILSSILLNRLNYLHNTGCMKTYRHLLFYIFTIGGFSLLVYFLTLKGTKLQRGEEIYGTEPSYINSWDQFSETIRHNLAHPLVILLLQIITIIVVARIFGFICKKIGQPTVIGEIAAGIFMGPSFIGTYLPEFSSFLFPVNSIGNLNFLSQIGLILFMFVIGMELDIKVLRKKAQDALVISHASIIVPFSFGIVLAYFIYTEMAPENVRFMPFALFIGVAMSITAFPVLARIVQEKGLSKTKLGIMAITCAAVDDITAWLMLAAVIAIVKAGSFVSAFYTILLVLVYLLIMLKVVRPFLKKIGEIYSGKEGLSKPIVAIFFVTLLLSACATEMMGIHALFGAFMAGVIMPENASFRNIFIEKMEDVALIILLPLFFVLSGLRTQVGLLADSHLWIICGWIILAAVAGKFLGSAIASRFTGHPWRDSLIIGALMNTRGLMELVVLNIGYDLGIMKPELFSMMVIMALVTTLMTGPALYLIKKSLPKAEATIVPENIRDAIKYKILVSFGNPEKGKKLIRLAYFLIRKSLGNASVSALHLSPSNDLHQYNTKEYELESFAPIEKEAKRLNLPVVTMFKPSQDVDREIVETANLGNFDLLLIGTGRSIFEGTLLGRILGFTTKFINPERIYDTLTGKENLFETRPLDDRTRHIVKAAKIPVGILIDKGFSKADNVFLPLFSASDRSLLSYVQKLIHNNESRITILDVAGIARQTADLKEAIRAIEQIAPNHITLTNDKKIEKEFLDQQDIMLISQDSWKKAVETQSIWLSHAPSVLIIRQ